jgi:hypothetical protein
MRPQSFERKYTKRERKYGAVDRPFTLYIGSRFIMLLAYYRLYIIYTLDIIYLIWIKAISVLHTKDKKFDKKMFTNSSEDVRSNKKAKDS